jgi:hypothetical protein
MSETTTTMPADPIVAQTQHAPAEQSFESVLSRQLNTKPKIPRTDIKSLENLPDIATPTPSGMDEVPTQEAEDFLKQLDGGSTEVEKPVEKKTSEPDKSSFDLSDIDLSKDSDVVEEKPKGKKSKEDNIAELRRKAEAAELELKTRDEKLNEYQSKLESLEAELERTAFEKSPKFKDKYQTPYSEAVDTAVAFAKEYADDASVAEKALSLKGKERLEFIDENFSSASAAAQFVSLINNADEKRGALEGAIENYKSTHQQIIQEEEKSKIQIVDQVNKQFDRMATALADRSDFFKKTGDNDTDKAVDARIQAARNIIHGNATQNEMIAAPFFAVIAKEAVEENAKLKAELAKYKSRAAADVAAQPRIARGASEIDNDIVGKPKSGLDSIKSQLRNL